jgi:hypothetical protein
MRELLELSPPPQQLGLKPMGGPCALWQFSQSTFRLVAGFPPRWPQVGSCGGVCGGQVALGQVFLCSTITIIWACKIGQKWPHYLVDLSHPLIMMIVIKKNHSGCLILTPCGRKSPYILSSTVNATMIYCNKSKCFE